MIVICEKSHCAIERLHETDQYISVYENKEIEINVDKHYDLACFTCAFISSKIYHNKLVHLKKH